jgi:hypothetical protein
VLVLPWLVAACTGPDARILAIQTPSDVLEGERAAITVTVKNDFDEPIIPVSLTVYARPSPAEYFIVRHIVSDVNYLQPLQAAEVRHLETLDRIEAYHVRDGDTWRRIPHSRFLHPHILLPGRSFTQDFAFQAYASYSRLLYADLLYLPLSRESIAKNLYLTHDQVVPPEHRRRHAQTYRRVAPDELEGLDRNPKRYLLYRPHRPDARRPRLLTRRIRLPVTRRAFSYPDAARRARAGARTHCFFSADEAWAFDYHDGTWIITPDRTIKLRGHYVHLIADLEQGGVRTLLLSAPRVPNDPLLRYFQDAGYSAPNAVTPQAEAAIPTNDLLTALEKAEALGYTITRTTWRPLPAAD